MIHRPTPQKGFAFVEVILVVVTVALIGFVAFRFIDNQNASKTVAPAPTETQDVALNSTADVDAAVQQADSVDLDSVDSELETEFNF
jgi:Tfp pilus assembly protein PilV